MLTLGEALRDATTVLERAGVASPLVDARLIAAHLLGCSPLNIALYMRDEVPAGFADAVQRRATREPLQHILGTAPMGSLDLHVGPGVFIPRPETEVLADWAVRQAGGVDKQKIVDLCTGSGALAAYIGHELIDATLYAVELDRGAATWAQRNFDEFAPGVQLIHGDVTDPTLLSDVHGTIDIVVSNPPYVPETQDLDPEVYQDPHMAVFSGADGMDVINEMVHLIFNLLRFGGVVGVEHDDTTSEAVQQVFQDHGGFDTIEVLKDLTGRARFVTARKL
ncbi:peptide chain release factor N(5)-glutamine methyltransferase [Corynebacterium crudilactis]|uniref:Release factor glutamine methyltransferase n=1 Tax=Corynebacterium crudilactis TaxID=1652495 RepID=A0A172QSZ5_9CORY|nr:peptide chain release factor N(5)-glutamine methyltransferase [Corynebacterium crudilactis]ANE03771.1 protein-(glutamine-N5) methyltransferase, release factor-specific [Corynebacterium crudilactis]